VSLDISKNKMLLYTDDYYLSVSDILGIMYSIDFTSIKQALRPDHITIEFYIISPLENNVVSNFCLSFIDYESLLILMPSKCEPHKV
jgi:hypothetical protein